MKKIIALLLLICSISIYSQELREGDRYINKQGDTLVVVKYSSIRNSLFKQYRSNSIKELNESYKRDIVELNKTIKLTDSKIDILNNTIRNNEKIISLTNSKYETCQTELDKTLKGNLIQLYAGAGVRRFNGNINNPLYMNLNLGALLKNKYYIMGYYEIGLNDSVGLNFSVRVN